VTSAALQTSGDMNGGVRRSNSAAPERNLADVRNRVRAGAAGTYILDMLSSQDSTLFRWPDRSVQGIRVWIQTEPHVPDWWVGYAQVARDVFAEWDHTGFPLRFEYAADSAGADITVRWVDRFPAEMDRRIGSTRRMSDQHAWIVNAQITVAVHDSRGRTFGPNELTGILRHEIGHALGLGHSRDQTSIMFPEEATLEIAESDRATLRLLYSLPPGSLR
jgi:predicted Zn-dependent protease